MTVQVLDLSDAERRIAATPIKHVLKNAWQSGLFCDIMHIRHLGPIGLVQRKNIIGIEKRRERGDGIDTSNTRSALSVGVPFIIRLVIALRELSYDSAK